jgi:hypothetical protein
MRECPLTLAYVADRPVPPTMRNNSSTESMSGSGAAGSMTPRFSLPCASGAAGAAWSPRHRGCRKPDGATQKRYAVPHEFADGRIKARRKTFTFYFQCATVTIAYGPGRNGGAASGDGGPGVKFTHCNRGRFMSGIDLHSIFREPHGVRGGNGRWVMVGQAF